MLRGFGPIARDLARAEEILERLPLRAFRETAPPGVRQGLGDKLRVGYFVGCGVDLLCPETAEAALDILCRLGKTVRVLENCCCGAPANTYGDSRATRRLAAKNLELIDPDALDVIVTDCSTCAAFLKKYPSLFHQTDPLHDPARRLASRVRDLVEMAPLGEAPPGDRPAPTIATYHDPCHASRGQGLVSQPRAILRSLAGVEFRELPEADWCCGGAGSYALAHFDLSMRVLDRKIDNVEKTGADLLVTSCPACMIQLAYGVRKRGLPVRVRHISQLVSQARPAS
jgi:glycolate oxidase iron-sulfur subunit